MNIHHIGYLVKNIENAKAAFIKLGYELKQDVVIDNFRKIKICFLKKNDYTIELVSPNEKNCVVGSLLKKIGNMPYHICYESDNFQNDLAQLESSGYFLFEEMHRAIAIENKNVCFLINPSIGIVELLEKE